MIFDYFKTREVIHVTEHVDNIDPMKVRISVFQPYHFRLLGIASTQQQIALLHRVGTFGNLKVESCI